MAENKVSSISSTGMVTTLSVRNSDTFVEIVELCATYDHKWKHYINKAATQELLSELSWSFPKVKLVYPNELGQIWVHPQIAMDCARWISPRCAVAVGCLLYPPQCKTAKVENAETIEKKEPVKTEDNVKGGARGGQEVKGVDNGVKEKRVDIFQDRLDSIHITKVKAHFMRTTLPFSSPAEYAVLANLANQIAMNFNTTSSKFKAEHKIQPQYPIADYMDSVGLIRRMYAEAGFLRWMKKNTSKLVAMSYSGRITAYTQYKKTLQQQIDLLDHRQAHLIPHTDMLKAKRELAKKRDEGKLVPSLRAHLLSDSS